MEEGQADAPLLERSTSAAEADGEREVAEGRLGFGAAVVNLIKCIIGAGLLSIPMAFSLLGAAGGTAVFVAVAAMTIFTIHWGQVLPSTSRDGRALLLGTYSSMVTSWAGRPAERLLTLMMMLGLVGFEVSYMDIIADLLVGDVPHHNPGIWASLVLWACGCEPYDGPAAGPADGRPGGALQQLAAGACAYGGAARLFRLPVAVSACLAAGAGSASQAARADTPLWVLLALDRRMVVLAVVAGVVVPLSLQRHMASLGAANLVGLASLAAFLLCLVWLSGAAVAEGTAHALPWLPDLETLGRTGTEQAIKAFGVLSVLLTANGCHANMHPLMSVMRPFSRGRVDSVMVTAIAISSSFYLLVSVCSYKVFGPDINEDILTNLSPPTLEPLVGRWAAQGMAVGLRLGYLLSILGSAVLTMFPLRQSVADLLLGPPPAPRVAWVPSVPPQDSQDGREHALQADSGSPGGPHDAALKAHATRRAAMHVPLTLTLLGLAYVLSVAIPSIWVVVSLIGSVSVTTLSFFMPAVVGLAALHSQAASRVTALVRGGLVFAGLIGIVIFVNGFIALAQ